jgi:hypothetical protein
MKLWFSLKLALKDEPVLIAVISTGHAIFLILVKGITF